MRNASLTTRKWHTEIGDRSKSDPVRIHPVVKSWNTMLGHTISPDMLVDSGVTRWTFRILMCIPISLPLDCVGRCVVSDGRWLSPRERGIDPVDYIFEGLSKR